MVGATGINTTAKARSTAQAFAFNASTNTLSSANVYVNTTTPTGTASQPLQVTGGAYVSGNVGFGVTNPTTKLDVLGIGQFNANAATLNLVGTDHTYIQWYPDGVAAGRKAYTGFGGATENFFTIANQISDGSGHIRLEPGANAAVLIDTTTETGTASQPLQVAGGAYFNGKVGIGTTNPSSDLVITEPNLTGSNVQSLLVDTQITSTNTDFAFGQKIETTLSGTNAASSDREQGSLYILTNSSTSGGDTNNEHRVYSILNSVDVSGDSDVVYGMYNDVNTSHVTGTITSQYGSINIVNTTSTSTITNLYGEYLIAEPTTGAAGTISNLVGVRGRANLGGISSSIVGNMYGVWANLDKDSTVSVSPSGITAALYVSYDTTTGFNNPYGVYVATTNADNYFAGNVGVGTTNPTSKLHIIGDANISGVTTTSALRLSGTGSTSAPAISFGSLLNGLHAGITNTIDIVTNGSTSFRVDSDQALVSAGTTAIPGLAFIGDTDTGLTASGPNQVEIICGSTEEFFINQSYAMFAGQLSVGTNVTPDRGPILTGILSNGGSGYVPGNYSQVPLTGGNGGFAYADIVVSVAGTVSSVLITKEGSYYLPNDILSATSASPFSTLGSGFTWTVSTVRGVDLQIFRDPARIRLGNSDTALGAGQELGSILFNCQDSVAGGRGDKVQLRAVAEGTSGGGQLQIWTAQNAGEASLGFVFDGNKDFRIYNDTGTVYTSLVANSSGTNKTVTFPNANVGFASAFTTVGAFPLTLTTTATTNVTLPTTGTLATLGVAETFSGAKTFTANPRLNDNVDLEIGTGIDMEIFHDATNNFIRLNNGNLIVRDGATNRFTFERTSGNLGIGTTPSYKTHILGSKSILALESTATTDRTNILFLTNGNDWELGARGSASSPNNSFYIFDRSSSLHRFAIDSLGEVVIGSSTPSTSLHVRLPSNSSVIGNVYIEPTTPGQARYHLYNGGSVAEWIFGQKTSTSHNFILSKMVAGSESDYFTVDTSGNATISGYLNVGSEVRIYNTANTFYTSLVANPTANRTVTFPNANVGFASAFTTSGAHSLTLTATAPTNVTLPTTGTLATLGGAETFSGAKTFTGNPRLNDNIELEIGTGIDMEIFHDATNNFIDLNNGNLIVRDGTTTRFTFEKTTGEFKSNGFISANLTYTGRTFQFDGNGSGTQDVGVIRQNNASFAHVHFASQAKRSPSSAWSHFWAMGGNGTSIGTDIEFSIRGDGYVASDYGSTMGTPADYAEMFEWLDGNPDNEDRRGYTVCLVGNKIRKSTETDGNNIIGAISGNPAVLADSAWNHWAEKYLKDDFNCYIYEEHEVIEWTDEETGGIITYESWNIPTDVIIPEDAIYKTHDENGKLFTHKKLNPEYDPTYEYVNREDRPEWDAVGLIGKLRIFKGQPVGPRWIKMRDISETVEEWLVR
jgi:hypothetical protein